MVVTSTDSYCVFMEAGTVHADLDKQPLAPNFCIPKMDSFLTVYERIKSRQHTC